MPRYRPIARIFPMLALAVANVCPQANAQSTPEDERAKAKQSEHDRRKGDEREEQIRRLVRRSMMQAEEAGDILQQASRLLDSHETRLQALLKNDDGKRIAADGTLALAILPLFEQPAGSADEIRTRKKTIDDIATSLRRELESVAVGFIPDAKTFDEIGDNYQWAKDRLSRVRERDATLDSLLQRAPKSVPDGTSTLEAHIRDYNAKRLELWAQARAQGEAAAVEPAKQVLVEKARLAELERAQAEAERLLRDARAQIERMKLDFDLELKKQAAENQRRQTEADIRYRDTLAELDRAKKLAEANRRVEDAKVDVKSTRLGLEADKTLDRQRCDDPEVKRLLAPFLAHGKYQPGMNKEEMLTADTKAISLSRLRAYGALEPTTTGIQKLLEIGTNKPLQRPIDTIRPRWGFKPRLRDNTSESVDEMKKAQTLLNDLGPTMVELGMLSP